MESISSMLCDIAFGTVGTFLLVKRLVQSISGCFLTSLATLGSKCAHTQLLISLTLFPLMSNINALGIKCQNSLPS